MTIPIPLPLTQLTPPDQGSSLRLLLCTQPSISSPYPNLTQHLTQCKTSPHAHDPTHHHPILTRPSPNLSEIRNLPSNLQHSPLTPHSNTCHHLLPPSPPKTTTTSIRNRPPMATHRHSHHGQRHKAGHSTAATMTQTLSWTRPRAGPKTGAMFGSETGPPNDVHRQLVDIFLGGGKWVQKWTLNWGRFSKPSGRIFSKPESACDNKTTFTRFTGKPVYGDASLRL